MKFLGRRLSPRLIVIITALLLVVGFFHRITLGGMILARGDLYTYFYPYWQARSTAFLNGQIPLWSPDVFMGVPLLANSQLGTFYPPNWLVTPFDAPTAVMLSLVAHLVWAILGVYLLTRRTLKLDGIPALLAGVLYGLGGYLGAQVEHINQLQALAWMPWLFLLFHQTRTNPVRATLLLGVVLALQLLAGHPQTVFITLVGLGIYGVISPPRVQTPGYEKSSPLKGLKKEAVWEYVRHIVRGVGLLVVAGGMAVVLALPQLLPTLELAGLGNRGGGLDPQRAMAFSFNPFLIGRGLLPSYDGLVFSEYLAYSGIIGLMLAVVGIFSRQLSVFSSQSRNEESAEYSKAVWIVLLGVGFFLALGLYNPLYWPLTNLPGFSFFRVPARWLALVALAVAVLAGVGLQSLKTARPRWWVYLIMAGIIGGLGGASFLADRMAVDVTGSALPTERTLIGWAVAVVVGLGLMWGIRPSPPAPLPQGEGSKTHRAGTLALIRNLLRARGSQEDSISKLGKPLSLIQWFRNNGWGMLAVAAVVELFAASQIMAYNQVVPPDVWSASRFTIDQLRVYAAEHTPMGRVLSITPLEFDPGDVEALKARYAELGMSELGIRIALVDTKMREVLAPNLSLAWGIPSVDGFDGGLLPTGYYSDFTALILPEGQEPTTDGRLREMLAQPECRGACIPGQDWLNLSNTQYLITDKTADIWHNDVAYDTTFTLLMADYIESQVNNPIGFQATAVDVLYTRMHCPEDAVCSPIVSTAASENAPYETLRQMGEREEAGGFQLVRWMMDVQTPFSVALTADRGVLLKIHAVTLVDTRTGDFQQLTLGGWRRVLSSDIKLYENGDTLPRAYVTRFASASIPIEVVMDNPLRYAFIDAPDGEDFGSNTAEVIEPPTAIINSYDAERVEIAVDSSQAGFLVLSDAYYPGWTATVNGEAATIYRTNMMFRGVAIPAGQSTVVFEYRPWWWPGVLIVGIAAWAAIGIGWVVLVRRKPSG